MRYILALIATLLLFNCGEKPQRPVSLVEHPQWSLNKTIYEANIRQHTPEGTFNAFRDYVPELKKLGVGIVWLMPIHPIGEVNRKGTRGSYYSVKNFLKINPEYGTAEEFRNLVQTIHKNGMYVILDWVANHTAWDNPWIQEHPEWYTRDSLGNIVAPNPDWTDVADLNYDNPRLRRAMIDALKYWVEEFNVDGYRCDVAEMVPVEFWNSARRELQQIKPVFMLAEGEAAYLHDKAFDMTYSWAVYWTMNGIASGKETAQKLDSLLNEEKRIYPENAFRMRFITNHDENSWNGTVFERLGEGVKAFAVLMSTIPGKPLLYSGQEIGLDKRLSFFEKDPIQWEDNHFREFYSQLFNLYQKNPALYSGSMQTITSQENIYAYLRESGNEKIFILLNLSPERKIVSLNSDVIAGSYNEIFSGVPVRYGAEKEFDLEPWAYRIFISTQK